MRNARLLLLNTVALTFGGFVMRTITVSFNVYLTNRIGAEGIGLFQLIMTVYSLAVTFAGAGIKLAATRLVTDSLTLNQTNPRQVMRVCIEYSLFAGLAVSMLLYVFSGIIGKLWIGDIRAVYSLKILSLSLPPISVSAALNGYFTAKKTMIKYSTVQLTEQLIKIAVTILSLNNCNSFELEQASGALCIGITAAEIISATISYLLYKKDTKKEAKERTKDLLSNLLRIAVPDVTGAGFRSVLLTVEHLLIPKGFQKSGNSAEHSMSVYGTIHGIALPVVLYPSSVLTSLSSLLIPELARYNTCKNNAKISFISSSVIKLTLTFSIGTALFMLIFSDTLSLAVYSDESSSFYIKVLSILIPVMYTDMITDGLLKGLDQQAASMRYNIFDSGICVILVYFLLPHFAVKGYIFILFLSEIINFSLSINRLIKFADININIKNNFIKPIVCGFISCESVKIMFTGNNISPKLSVVIAVLICGSLFTLLIHFTESISSNEIKSYKNMFRKSYA